MKNGSKKKNIVLLTATITPRTNQPNLALADPAIRLQEYRTALEFYEMLLNAELIDGVVFGENSGFDLEKLAQQFPSEKIEWLGYDDLDYSSEFHRGYGEFRLIDKCFQNSNFLQNLNGYDAVWKISGRYILKNLSSMINRSPERFDIYCDVRNGWAEMSVLAWSISGYQAVIKDIWKEFASNMAPELVLANIIALNQSRSLIFTLRYGWPPYLIGRRGTDGSTYQGRLHGIKFCVSAIRSFGQLLLRKTHL